MSRKEAWAKHPMRSEHNLSPEQLWTSGLQRIAGSSSHIAKEVFENIDEVRAGGLFVSTLQNNHIVPLILQDEIEPFGVDWEGPISEDTNETQCARHRMPSQ